MTEGIRTNAEARIRALIDGWAKAMRAKDADGVMSHYAADNVTFDLAPPLISAAANAKGLEAWSPPGKARSVTRSAISTSRRAMTWRSATASTG
jgi:ketosteroid isomerase-like protein